MTKPEMAEESEVQENPPYMFRWLDDVPEGYEVGPRCPHAVRFARSLNRADTVTVRSPSLRWHSLTEAVQFDWLRPMGYCRRCDGSGIIEVDKPPKTVVRGCLCGGGPGPYGERPCGQCGGTGALLDLEQQDPREMCPDCEGRGVTRSAVHEQTDDDQSRPLIPNSP